MGDYGVVLGGGGVLGVSWEIGVLAALSEAGVDLLGGAASVVGTSAGSLVATRMLLGTTVAELVEEQRQPTTAPGAGGPPLDTDLFLELYGRWTNTPAMTEEVAQACGELALKATTIGESEWVGYFAEILGAPSWPQRDLRLVAVSCDSGERAAWSPTSGVDLVAAVASSCAVPGMFPPVTVEPGSEARYTDGGLWSGTNADLLSNEGLDSVVIIEPMSAVKLPLGEFSARALLGEITALTATDTQVATVSPSADYADLGMELMNVEKRVVGLEIGLRDGAAAVETVRSKLPA